MTDTPIPKCYVVVTSYIRCVACAHVTQSSEFYARTTIRARHAVGKPVTHLERCDRPLYRLPVEHVAAQRTTAFCLRCHAIDLSHLPPPPTASQLYDLAEPILKNPRAQPRGASPRPAQPVKLSIKDLA